MTKEALEKKMASLLSEHLPDVKVNIYGLDEDTISADVVSDRYETDSIVQRLGQVLETLYKDKQFSDMIFIICPVNYAEFATRKEV